MSVQILDSGVSLEIITNGITKSVLKTNIKTVEVLINTMIKIDIGKSSLYDIYVDQLLVTNPVSSGPADLKAKIMVMLQPLAIVGSGATEANQLLQIAELQNIKNSVINLNNKVTIVYDNMILEPKLVDETEGNIIYKGYAVPGTTGDDLLWAIQRVTNDGGNLSYHWAMANKNFDKKWIMRREYQYS